MDRGFICIGCGRKQGFHHAGVALQQMGEVVPAHPRSNLRCDLGAMDDKGLVNGRDVRGILSDVDDNTRERVRGVELGERTVEDGEGWDVETLEKDLAGAFVQVPGRYGAGKRDEDWGFVHRSFTLQVSEQNVFPVYTVGMDYI